MFFKASSAPPHPPPRRRRSPELCGEAGARPRVGRRRRNDGDLWVERGKRRNREEREILYSLLLQQQLQLHLLRRHQGYFCNRSPLCVCVLP